MGCGAGKTSAPEAGNSTSPSGQVTVTAESPRKQYGQDELQAFIGGIPLFAKLPKSDHAKLVEAFERRVFDPGQTIVKQGDMGDELYIIAQGEAVVKMSTAGSEEITVAILQQGEFFGENALLHDQTRNATITAQGNMTCYSLSKKKFEILGLREKIMFPKRKAVPVSECPKERREGLQAMSRNVKKTKMTENVLANCLKSNANLKAMLGDLEDEQVRNAIQRAWRMDVPKGKELIMQGDLSADEFYLVEKGRFEVFIENTEKSTVDQMSAAVASAAPQGFSPDLVRKSCMRSSIAVRHSGRPPAGDLTVPAAEAAPPARTLVAEKGPGSSFGELALIHSAPRAATIQCSQDATVWVIDRSDFKGGLIEYAEKQADKWCGLLEQVELIQKLGEAERRAVSQECIEVHYHDDEHIIDQGEEGDSFFIIQVGTCNCLVNGEQVKTMMRGDFFGERALLSKEPRAATVIVAPDYGGADLLRLDQDAFEETLGPKAFGRVKHLFLKAAAQAMTMKSMESKKTALVISPSQLTTVGNLGVGAFGKTTLEKDASSGKTYALKRASKGRLKAKAMENSAVNEQELLMTCNSPFVVGLHCSYRDDENLYFVLEACLGGELCAAYQKKALHGNESIARFYVGCVAQALVELQKHQIIHRDVKPENVLIDARGYGKICNFGLAKTSIGRTYTFCGTPEYLAPEVVSLKSGYGRSADWWATGVLLYELMTGETPFDAPDPMQIYKNIKIGVELIKWGPKFNADMQEIITGLLEQDPRSRLGIKGKFKKFQDQAFWQGFSWPSLENRTMDPPYKPEVSGDTDLSNFNQAIEEPEAIAYESDGTNWEDKFDTKEELEEKVAQMLADKQSATAP